MKISLNAYDLSILKNEDEIDICDPQALREELFKTRSLCKIFDTIIENLSDTIYVTDGEANTMKVNKVYEELSGLSRSEILGTNMKDLLNHYISNSGSLLVLESKKEVKTEIFFHKTNQRAFITSKPIYDNHGNLSMILSNSRNFKEIQQLEEQLIETTYLANQYKAEIDALKANIFHDDGIIAEDKAMVTVLLKSNKVAKVDSTTLVLGETGVGKEEIARYIHNNSHRAKGPFIKVNCGALTESLIESELFGYDKGAFTGASKSGKPGLFESANKGSIFLDEIGELPLNMQVKLLRVLQENQVTRIGAAHPIDIDVRIIAATNRDLVKMIEENLFREDLYYRFNVVPITVPPLRQRPDDIIPLANLFLGKLNKKYNFKKNISNLAYHFLKKHPWPGNVRELRNVIEQAFIMCEGDHITVDDLPFKVQSKKREAIVEDQIHLKELLEKVEYDYIQEAYLRCKSVRAAAKFLKMNYSTYERKRIFYQEKYGEK